MGALKKDLYKLIDSTSDEKLKGNIHDTFQPEAISGRRVMAALIKRKKF